MMAELLNISYPNGNELIAVSKNTKYYPQNTANQWHIEYNSSACGLDNAINKVTQKNRQNEIETPAVVVRNASKYYTKGVPVLQNLNMTVQRGAIYSLLGSSGCGKTTLINCIMGIQQVSEGDLYIFGTNPGLNKEKMIGYMPQEICLYGDFSIAETLSYFGTLSGMERESAKKTTAFLTQLLKLPDSSRRVDTLSGGQKRRVSFAVALIHDPELLILDEPTVGVDPLLREHIWNYLVHLSQERGRTILITTHYFDEAKQSSVVAFMRHGKILVEHEPTQLLESFNSTTLETVVLELCKKDGIDNDKVGGCAGIDFANLQHDIQKPDDTKFTQHVNDEDGYSMEKIFNSGKRVKSLIQKNIVILFRNLVLFFFSVIVPSIMALVMCVTFKSDTKNLGFGVVNYEMPNLTDCINLVNSTQGQCVMDNLSCQYLTILISDDVVDLVSFENEDQAAIAVHQGSIWGYMIFSQNYSSFFYERSALGVNIKDDEVFNESSIVVKMDQTSTIVVNRVKKSFLESFEEYAKRLLKNCEYDEKYGEFPLQFHKPIFGTDDMKFIDFVAPSYTIACMFFFPIVASSIRYITEKKQGTHLRTLVAGTQTWEILFAYGCTECFVLVAQSTLIYIVITVVAGIEILGSVPLVMLLYLLTGFSGVSLGFCIGSLLNEEVEAALLALALYLPNLVLAGIFWPIEGMPVFWQYFSYALPCTLAGESMRSIFCRGWSFSHPNVWPGFVTILGYTLLYFSLTILIQKFKSK